MNPVLIVKQIPGIDRHGFNFQIEIDEAELYANLDIRCNSHLLPTALGGKVETKTQ